MKLVKRIETVQNNLDNIGYPETSNINNYEQLLKKFDDCFAEIGCVKNYIHHFDTDASVTPTVAYRRKIPHALKPKLRDELDRMVKMGVAVKEDEPTDWVNPKW